MYENGRFEFAALVCWEVNPTAFFTRFVQAIAGSEVVIDGVSVDGVVENSVEVVATISSDQLQYQVR